MLCSVAVIDVCFSSSLCPFLRAADGLGHSTGAGLELLGPQILGWPAGVSLPPFQLSKAAATGLDVRGLHGHAAG